MTTRLAILCPGQGAQHAGMFDLARTDKQTATMLDAWHLDARLGMPLQHVLDHPTLLFSNAMAQPLVVAATLAAWVAVRDLLPKPVLVAGYSVGEVAAYGVTESISCEDAIRLAAVRAELMDRCIQADRPQSLLAVSGIQPSLLCEFVHQHGLYIAIETSEDSFIVGGLRASILNFASMIAHAGAHSNQLPIAVASHTPLMQAAVAPFLEKLVDCRLVAPNSPVLSSISADLVFRKEEAQASLARQIAEKIQWADCMDACAEQGLTMALELGPGCSLSRMLHARHPHIICRSISNFRTIAGFATWLRNRLA